MGDGASPFPWPSGVPELTTKQLRLRSLAPTDAAALLGMLGDPEVTRYHSVPTFTTIGDAQAALERLDRRFAARDAIRWAVEPIERGEMIGTVGLLRFDFEHRHAEIGYDVTRREWGRGLATEAAAAVITYGFSILGLHRIEAGILPGNDASVRVVQKLGFLEEGLRRDYLYAKGLFHTFRWFSLLATDPREAVTRAAGAG